MEVKSQPAVGNVAVYRMDHDIMPPFTRARSLRWTTPHRQIARSVPNPVGFVFSCMHELFHRNSSALIRSDVRRGTFPYQQNMKFFSSRKKFIVCLHKLLAGRRSIEYDVKALPSDNDLKSLGAILETQELVDRHAKLELQNVIHDDAFVYRVIMKELEACRGNLVQMGGAFVFD